MQKFCKEAVTWRTLHHPNVLPLIGVTMTETKFVMVSDWMVNGNLNEFVEANPDADRLKLVSSLPLHSLCFVFIGDRMVYLAGRHH